MIPSLQVRILTLSGKEGNSGALGSGATSPTNAMNIILRVVRVVIVQHMSDVTNIFQKVSKLEGKSVDDHDDREKLWHVACNTPVRYIGSHSIRSMGRQISGPGNLGDETTSSSGNVCRLSTQRERRETEKSEGKLHSVDTKDS